MSSDRRVRILQIILLPVIVLTMNACGGEPVLMGNSQGADGALVVVTDSTLANGEFGESFKELFEREMFTIPQPEQEFDVSFVTGNGGIIERTVRRNKAIIFAAVNGSSSYAGSVIDENLSEEEKSNAESGTTNVFKRENLWARNQLVLFLKASDQAALVEAVREQADALRSEFNVLDRNRLMREMFSDARQEDKEKELMQKHRFAINVQHDYFYGADTTGLVWLRRQPMESRRELMIRYFDNADASDITPEWIIERRDEMVQMIRSMDDSAYVMTYQPDENTERLQFTSIDFLGRQGYETRGLWQLVIRDERGELLPLEGGPFVNYTFFDPEQRRIYMIDGMVFAPRYDKREFVRQMETIAYTFRTAADVRTQENS